jgi:hypothetical protein
MLLAAGISNVIWISVDMLTESCANIFSDAIAPAVQLLESGADATAVEALIREELESLVKRDPPICSAQEMVSVCGCIKRDHAPWTPNEESEEPFVRNLALKSSKLIHGVNMELDDDDEDEDEGSVNLLACDLHCVEELHKSLSSLHKVSIVTVGCSQSAARRRSIALEACKMMRPERRYKHIWRVSSANDVRGAKAAIKKDASLVWVDLTGQLTADDIDEMLEELMSAKAMRKNAHLILTCDDELTSDKARASKAQDLAGKLRFEQLCTGKEAGLSGVYADDLHDEFKLLSAFGDDSSLCLLDVRAAAAGRHDHPATAGCDHTGRTRGGSAAVGRCALPRKHTERNLLPHLCQRRGLPARASRQVSER